jgi:hypothetical protein
VTNPRQTALSPALIATIAIVAVGVVGLLLLILFNTAGSALRSSPQATGTPGALATARPGSSATPANGTDAPATDAPATDAPLTAPPSPAGSLTPEQALVAHVPEPIRPSCTVEPGRRPVLLVARCTADNGALTVNYYEYGSAEDMAGEYADLLDGSQIEPDTGRCEEAQTWPAESEYSVGGQITGRRLCTEQPGSVTIYWTDDRLNILGQVASDSSGHERLIEFWTNESGPVP